MHLSELQIDLESVITTCAHWIPCTKKCNMLVNSSRPLPLLAASMPYQYESASICIITHTHRVVCTANWHVAIYVEAHSVHAVTLQISHVGVCVAV